jgi:hypothetical protein
MKSRYDNTPGKDAPMANLRQRRFESEHSAKDAFVKRVQAEQGKYAGRPPKMEAAMMEFNAYMSNDGMHAQEFGKKLTKGLDKVAFPVDGEGNDS